MRAGCSMSDSTPPSDSANVKIDVPGVRHEPELLGRSRTFKQNLRVSRRGSSIFFAAHNEHWALDVGNVIDRPQLR